MVPAWAVAYPECDLIVLVTTLVWGKRRRIAARDNAITRTAIFLGLAGVRNAENVVGPVPDGCQTSPTYS